MLSPQPQSSEREAAPERQYRCDECEDAPFASSDAYHNHRTLHQLRADVTLPDGTTAKVSRRSESTSWRCPEDNCDYASLHLLRLRGHLRDQRKKRCRQQDALALRTADDDSLDPSDVTASSQHNSRSPSLDSFRRVRPRLDTNDAAPTSRVSWTAALHTSLPRRMLTHCSSVDMLQDHSRPAPASARVPTSTRRRTEPTNAGHALLVTARRRTETNEAAQALLVSLLK